MSDQEYRAFLDLLMCSDPWPVESDRGDGGQDILLRLAGAEGKKRGYDNWIVAYHEHPRGEI